MKPRKLLFVAFLFMLLVVGISAVYAQDNPQPDQRPQGLARALIGVVSDSTGLETREIWRQLNAGTSLTDIIRANGGDVDQVVDDTIAFLTGRISQDVADGTITQERADHLLVNLANVVTRAVNGELFPNRLDPGAVRSAVRRILIRVTADATGLRPAQITEQLRDGSTLADVITANGADVDTVINDAIAAATEQINAAVAEVRLGQEQAERLLNALPDLLNRAVSGELRQEMVEWGITRGLIGLAAEQTGLQPHEIAQELRAGKSLADVLADHDVDVNTFMDSAVAQLAKRLELAVANKRITPERADELLATFRDRLTEGIHQVRPQTVESLDIK